MMVLLLAFAPAVFCADDDSVLFSDDFSTLDPGWGDANANKNVADGKLVVKADAKGYYYSEFDGTTFNDADIRLKVCLVDGMNDEPGGLVFWADPHNSDYYAALYQSDGDVTIGRNSGSNWLNPVPWKHNDAVKQGTGAVNEIRVVTKGKTATVYINDTQVTSFKGFPPAGGSLVGIYGESGDKVYTWSFDDLVVRKVQ
jgi:hypothetical protein